MTSVVAHYDTLHEMKRLNLVSRRPLSYTNPQDNLRQTNRPKIGLKSCNLTEALGAFLLIPSAFSFVVTEERVESGHTDIKPRSVECCSDVCPSVGFSDLHIWPWRSTRVTIRFLVTTLTKAILHQLLSLARRPALRRILVVSNFFY